MALVRHREPTIARNIAMTSRPYSHRWLESSIPTADSLPVRVFRADTPQEVASASIVADELAPGRDVLAIYGGGSYGSPEVAVASLRAMACAHAWEAIVDLTDLPVKEVSGTNVGIGSRLARTRATVATVRGIRDRLAPVLGVSASSVEAAIDEVYVSVLTAGTMVTAYALSRTARKCCYPHTFTSVGHEQYVLDFPQPLRGRVADVGKRLVWGPEAVPTRHVHIDLAVTFWREPDWAVETVSLAHAINVSTMRRLFGSLPVEVRGYFEGLAHDCEPPIGVLLLESGDAKLESQAQSSVELRAYLQLVDQLAKQQGLKTLVVKPHPRMPPQRVEEVTRAIGSQLTELRVVPLRDHASLPIEVVAVPFDIVACASIISTALCTLPLIYGITGYYDRHAAEQLYGAPQVSRILTEWTQRLPTQLSGV